VPARSRTSIAVVFHAFVENLAGEPHHDAAHDAGAGLEHLLHLAVLPAAAQRAFGGRQSRFECSPAAAASERTERATRAPASRKGADGATYQSNHTKHALNSFLFDAGRRTMIGSPHCFAPNPTLCGGAN
jgi:hypothetical protein